MRFQDVFLPVRNGDLSRYPTISQQSAHASTSEHYAFISTMQPVNVLREMGWEVSHVAQQKVRLAEKNGFQRHALKFMQVGQNQALTVGQTIPQLVLVNSHEGSAAFRFFLGLFEVRCSNGLMVERGSLAEMRVLHRGYTDQKVADGITSVLPQIPAILTQVETWKSTKLETPEVQAFAESAIELRWDAESKTYVNPKSVSQAIRKGQEENTLYNVFNRVQEGILRGGVYTRNKDGVSTRARAVKSLAENERLNRALWSLAAKMAELKGYRENFQSGILN